ncbi:TIGR02680 family protein [Fodinisporobacter ferrooxydans]|uniref:TIGR02680 family protein n=1 Tax=Fodinisporobacter ferrooxydans TaxID=2901836 RepID=A0ABY4CMK2_9BACL|nr:TIGR02680 family protein [Alicyclobacillaceae bacterium MYW30-H2]
MQFNRWCMNRAGIFNFWYYHADEVFHLSDGRLIFRGTNGSGKSVTMQSFLPLVLDGDKRPSRLDPFGSKDRKIEFYLLGESESGIQDRTGYLYLEFHQPVTDKYLTVGIGLRARRGAAQVGFWGFAVTDQRRIGKDIFLYDVDLFEKHGQKVPLDRTGLEVVIGDGGKVVREQGEYRQLINKLLFGFSDPEAYKELLDLMIQLRSPKLSKDFKPSTIYGILNDALPPLSEEELRPLSEVLEDMDEISDRLDELSLHRSEAQKLADSYDQYNEYRLFNQSVLLLQEEELRKQKAVEVSEQEQAWNRLMEQYEQNSNALNEANEQLMATETEIELLNRSEAMEKQHELKAMQERLQETQQGLNQTNARLRAGQQEKDKKENRLLDVTQQLEQQLPEQQTLQRELDDLAKDVEFYDHDLYERQWKRLDEAVPEQVWASWRRDLAVYREQLKHVLQECVKERDLAAKMKDAETSMSVAREKRDAAERTVRAKEEALQTAIIAHEDRLLAWFKSLQRLPVAEEAFHTMLQRLQRYPELAYEEIVEPCKKSEQWAQAELTAQRLQAEHECKLKRENLNQLQVELQAWKEQREPEPERSEARKNARKRRMESSNNVGGPLYALCEFKPHVGERTKAVLETALHHAGLLDAWISPDAIEILDQEEESWLRPSPVLYGHTLADYLEPTPSAECGLTKCHIDDVLRTIQVGEEMTTGASITESGSFHLGPLSGQVAGKERAEWIGAEARRQTRLAAIQKLEENIKILSDEMDSLLLHIQDLQVQSEQIRAELLALPPEDELRSVYKMLQEAKAFYEHAQKIEADCSVAYKEATHNWREQQRVVLEKTAKWSRLKREKDFQDALEILQDYERLGNSLKSTLVILGRMRVEAEQLQEELEEVSERIRMEQEQLEHLQEREKQQQASAHALTKLVQELGLYDVYERLQALQSRKAEWKQTIDDCNAKLRTLESERGATGEKLQQKRSELEQKEQDLQDGLQIWRTEWNLQLVGFELDHPIKKTADDMESMQACLKTAQAIRVLFRSRYESRKIQQLEYHLQDAFTLAKNALLDYSLEQRYDSIYNRILIESLRDRNQPWTPRMLLRELVRLEEQQKLLIDEKDRELYEQILIHSVGRAIKDKINRAEQWVRVMNQFMESRKTSSGLVLSLDWKPKAAHNERELDTEQLVRLLRKHPSTLLDEEIEQMVEHFRSRIQWAKEDAAEGEGLRRWIQELLDYRNWFAFTLYVRKGSQSWRELTDSRFNTMSGGERAMAMYIPLFAATDSRYKDSSPDAPRIITLDEAFAGVDDENMRDMFQLLTEMQFDYMMTSQVLWGCYDTVPSLSIYEIYRPQDVDFVTLIPYYWNGVQRRLMGDQDWEALNEVAAAREEE